VQGLLRQEIFTRTLLSQDRVVINWVLIVKRTALALTLILALFPVMVTVQPVKAQFLNVHIKNDGSIVGTEGTNDIQRIGDTYILKNSINGSIFVEKDNVTIDGAGYSLQGSGSGTGIGLSLITDRLGYSGVTIKNLQIKGFTTGISFSNSFNNIISRCNISDCSHGIRIDSSSNNVFSGNYLHNNSVGIGFVYSPNNVLTSNRLDNNGQSLWFESDWINSIDSSNTINGKPIYYLVNEKDLVISPSNFPEIGYLALVNSTRITVKNLNRSNATIGIILAYTINSTLTQNILKNNWIGISLYRSGNNSITENYCANNEYGIYIQSTYANAIIGNNVEKNNVGIYLEGANQNIYHNNFINNSKSVDATEWNSPFFVPLPNGIHVWDDGYPSGGNYWSDYKGTDANHDGIGDTPYVVSQYLNNTDHYPLVEPVVIIPEFPSWIILPLFIIVTFLTAVVYFKKRKH
jgi:parallel beta-helix repeat protein